MRWRVFVEFESRQSVRGADGDGVASGTLLVELLSLFVYTFVWTNTTGKQYMPLVGGTYIVPESISLASHDFCVSPDVLLELYP